MVERILVEINRCVNYNPIKSCLIALEEAGDINMDSIRVANVGTTLLPTLGITIPSQETSYSSECRAAPIMLLFLPIILLNLLFPTFTR